MLTIYSCITLKKFRCTVHHSVATMLSEHCSHFKVREPVKSDYSTKVHASGEYSTLQIWSTLLDFGFWYFRFVRTKFARFPCFYLTTKTGAVAHGCSKLSVSVTDNIAPLTSFCEVSSIPSNSFIKNLTFERYIWLPTVSKATLLHLTEKVCYKFTNCIH